MRPTEPAATSPAAGARPHWSVVLRALREARGVTLDGWAARIGVSRTTVQRWERGERAPDPGAETAILAYSQEAGLLRAYDRGPLGGLTLTAELLQDLLAEARLSGNRLGVPGRSPDRRGLGKGNQPLVSAHDGVGRSRTGSPSPDEFGNRVDAAQHSAPIRSAQGGPRTQHSNLPAPLTSFVGRQEELAALRRALAGTRLLTLTGVGGCGKTRLALELAGELLWAYPHGVCVVELAALADPALVPATVAAALGLHPTGVRPIIALLQEQLGPRHLLLVLDNCEHLLGACAALVETLLRACPHLEVLTTSREALGIGGETLWHVPRCRPPMPPGCLSSGRGAISPIAR